MTWLLRRLLLACMGLFLASCLSPTLPLPPPTQPEVSSPDAEGFVRLQGIAAPRAEVLAWNRNSGLISGQVTGENSRFDFLIRAAVDDTIELWYTKGTDESQSVVFSVPSATR